MKEWFYPILDALHPKQHLSVLPGPGGKQRTIYDSVSYCNRCNLCSANCPSYRLTQDEFFSPRGRNQIIRLVMEEKIKILPNQANLQRSMDGCLLCGACMAACPGGIPTPQHVLEMHRTLRQRPLPWILQKLLHWRTTAPAWFEFLINTGRLARNIGIIFLLRKCTITKLPFLRWLNHADEILPPKTVFLKARLKRQKIPFHPQNPDVFFLPSLEAGYLDSKLGLSCLRWLEGKRTEVLFGLSSGLFEYVYGSLRLARHAAQKIIKKAGNGTAPLVTDSADVYLFLKNYPLLFSHNRTWEKKARRLAARVRFIADYIPAKTVSPSPNGRVQLDTSALFSFQTEAFVQSEKILRAIFKKNLLHYGYKDTPTPAFGYCFRKNNIAKEVCFCRVKEIARTQTDKVFLLSGLSVLELNFWLKRYYPGAKAEHIASLNG